MSEKPMLKKLTPEEIKARRVTVDKIEQEIISLQRQIDVWLKDLEEDLPNKRMNISIREKQCEIEAKQADIKSHKKIIKESERA